MALVHHSTFMRRLARDTGGNTLAIMAASLVPLIGFAGSAIDMTRVYVVKVRLQQACDAGVLAGRKFMLPTNDPKLDDTATARARSFFANNFQAGWMGTTTVSFVPAKTTEQQVSGVAKATVPMTLMKMFASPDVPLTINCEARYDVADADIMFVLDTTGSMACLDTDDETSCNNYVLANTVQRSDGGWSVTEKNNSRLSGVRDAVVKFYDNVATKVDPTTHLRFGFLPYSNTVNVGRLLDRNWISTNTAQYQTRIPHPTQPSVTSGSPVMTYSLVNGPPNCNAPPRSPATGYKADYSYTVSSASYNAPLKICAVSTQKWVANFRYISNSWNVANFAAFNPVITPTIPLMGETTQPTSTWSGCIEERLTTPGSTFDVNNPPADLDPNLTPSSEAERWRPHWPEVEYSRTQQTQEDSASNLRTPATRYQYGNGTTGLELGYTANQIACPPAAQRLAEVTPSTKSSISNYVNAAGFRPDGNTYHDIGMIWGSRMLSPYGPFKADTTAWPGHNSPNRYIIFLTDGEMQPDLYAYSAYGMEQFDQRVTGGASSQAQQEARHNTRFTTACKIARDRLNIRIFVIAYAQALTPQLTDCGQAPGRAFFAKDTKSLQDAFDEIAKQIAMLRISG